jgi:hypothetical protein
MIQLITEKTDNLKTQINWEEIEKQSKAPWDTPK